MRLIENSAKSEFKQNMGNAVPLHVETQIDW